MTNVDQLRDRITKAAKPVEPIAVKPAKIVRVTAGELRAACDKNPRHPLAGVKRDSVAAFPDDQAVYVEQIDLLAILDDADVVIEDAVEGDTRVLRKSLRAKAAVVSPATKPAVKPADPAPAKKD